MSAATVERPVAHSPAGHAARAAVISARALTTRYRMGEVDVMALRGVDLELVEGELMVLLRKGTRSIKIPRMAERAVA